MTLVADEAPSRREREKAAHRREILQAAVRVFARKGFASATIDEIAQEAEFSKGAVYLHFGSKEELLSTILIEVAEAAICGVRAALAGTRPLRQELTDLYQRTAELAFAHGLHRCSSMPMHLSQFSGLSVDTRTRLGACRDQVVGHLRDRIRQAQQAGEVRDVCVDAAAGLVHGALDSMVLTRWGRESIDELKQAAEEVIEILFGGIAQRKE